MLVLSRLKMINANDTVRGDCGGGESLARLLACTVVLFVVVLAWKNLNFGESSREFLDS